MLSYLVNNSFTFATKSDVISMKKEHERKTIILFLMPPGPNIILLKTLLFSNKKV